MSHPFLSTTRGKVLAALGAVAVLALLAGCCGGAWSYLTSTHQPDSVPAPVVTESPFFVPSAAPVPVLSDPPPPSEAPSPRPTAGHPATSAPVGDARAGARCKHEGETGYTRAGVPMLCVHSRWRAA